MYRYSLAPLLVAKENVGGEKKKNFFPMELCLIMDNQRAKARQQDPIQIQVRVPLSSFCILCLLLFFLNFNY